MTVDDFKGENGLWVKSYGNRGADRTKTVSYMKWSAMMSRCSIGGSIQNKHSTYIGCSASELFTDFQSFTDWHIQQVGYGVVGYQLDKDILVSGNKTYSEDVCVLVPQELNKFLTSRDAARGEYHQGVSLHRQNGRFQAEVRFGSKTKYLGCYDTVTEASSAYKAAKDIAAYSWYERLKAKEFTVDERVIERMRTWTFTEVDNVL